MYQRGNTKISKQRYRINEQIRVPKARLIGPDGVNQGVVPTEQALEIARDSGLDLVEVAPDLDPPVCRILDYGKFLYQASKKAKEARRAQKQVDMKEIRLRPKTTEHHRSFKVRDARRWLESGIKVKVRIRFRGREITLPEVARQEMDEISSSLSDIGHVEVAPSMEGRTMLMIIAPGEAKHPSQTNE